MLTRYLRFKLKFQTCEEMQAKYLSKIGLIFRDTQQFQLPFSSPLKLHKTVYLCNLQPSKKRSPVISHKRFLADKCE